VRLFACPNALKGVLTAGEAAAALVEGMRRVPGAEAEELPVADGGDGTADVLAAALGGEWRSVEVAGPLGRPVEARWLLLPEGTAVVESAEAIGLRLLGPDERDALRASSRGLGELVAAALDAGPAALLVGLGGSATVDGGSGLLEVLRELSVPTRVACDVASPLLGPLGAARAYGPQKGATPEQVEVLEARLAARRDLDPVASLRGAGAAGGLGAAFAALGAELVPGAELVLDVLDFRARIRGAGLVVTGEGIVDRTTAEGKAPAVVARICHESGVRCAVFGGRVEGPLEGVETHALSGRPERAPADLVELGERLVRALLGFA
jgi:glycerate 2-kinase